MAAFVGATPASSFTGSGVGAPLASRRHVAAAPVARRPPPVRMMATEDFGEWKKKADKKGSKTTIAEKTNAEVKVDDAVQAISEDTTEANVTAFHPPTVDTTVFRCVAVDRHLPGWGCSTAWPGFGVATGWHVGGVGRAVVLHAPHPRFGCVVAAVRFSDRRFALSGFGPVWVCVALAVGLAAPSPVGCGMGVFVALSSFPPFPAQ